MGILRQVEQHVPGAGCIGPPGVVGSQQTLGYLEICRNGHPSFHRGTQMWSPAKPSGVRHMQGNVSDAPNYNHVCGDSSITDRQLGQPRSSSVSCLVGRNEQAKEKKSKNQRKVKHHDKRNTKFLPKVVKHPWNKQWQRHSLTASSSPDCAPAPSTLQQLRETSFLLQITLTMISSCSC